MTPEVWSPEVSGALTQDPGHGSGWMGTGMQSRRMMFSR
jgi:hypothetical protein